MVLRDPQQVTEACVLSVLKLLEAPGYEGGCNKVDLKSCSVTSDRALGVESAEALRATRYI